MSRMYRYGFPVFASLIMGAIFLIPIVLVKAFVVAFTFWAAMEAAGRLNDL